jgi:hypothetical protein
VAAAFADGHVTAEQVAVVAPVLAPQHQAAAAAQGIDLAEVDAVLAAVAATRQHPQLGRVVHHYLARLNPDGTEPDPTEGRSLTLSKHVDGSLTLRGELDAVGGEKTPSAGRSCRPRWNPSSRPTGPPATCAPAPSNSATRSSSSPTTPSPPAACPSCAPSSPT